MTEAQEWRHLSRKFIVCLLVMGLSQWALRDGLIDAKIWLEAIRWAILAFCASNVGEVWLKRKVE